jgi:hypothetical protein
VSVCRFILIRVIEHFVVLVGLEAMAEQQKLDSDLRRQLEEANAYVRLLKTDLAEISTEEDTGSFIPINAHTTWSNSDTGATLHSWS